ncbi:MAG: nucleoside kinase [Lachnospiraceae bacterium]|nr:nucleoside kinase [Lachnospiraceae bacterium]
MVTLKINGKEHSYDEDTTYEKVVADYQAEYDNLITLVVENGKLKELFRKPKDGAEISFITRKDDMGRKAYQRTVILIMVKAIDDVLGGDKSKYVKVEFAIGKGYYVSPKGGLEITEEFLRKVEARMKEIVEADLPIVKKTYSIDDAVKLFADNGMMDKVKLFKYRRSSSVNVYELDGYPDYFYGYMLPRTSYAPYFDLVKYDEGFMLVMPDKKNLHGVPEYEPLEKLYGAMMTATQWGQKLGIDTVGDLNDKICSGELSDVIMVQEALQERRIAEIAKDIYERGGVKFVMIAGPSSSGKTSFSHRLSIQLASYGLKPHPIPVDDYFVNREDTPLDENGNYNFECIEAIDTKQFNDDMLKLLAGERVELPTFNFKTGKREYKGNYKQLGKDDILVIEGIHGLNDKMSYALPKESKYKVYISALTCLNVDEHNRIATTDGRLLRRMVRDARTRGTSAQGTIRMWPSVRRGEEENIFPFQESADATFNSALIYELAVLKQFAEPLLFAIGPDEPEYYEAKRLLKFLEYFLGVSSEHLPNNSLVREFVGGSVFPV